MNPRPAVAVVVPLGGARNELIGPALAALELRPGDEIVVVLNGAEGQSVPGLPERARIKVARDLRSSYHARNAGVRATTAPWILFIDGDCQPSADILERYLATEPAEAVAVLAGRIDPADGEEGLLAVHARTRGLLDQEAFLAREQPFAVTANLLVRRSAWAQVGGFREVRSGGDVDFSWRLTAAGWELAYRPDAVVLHRHRVRLREFMRQRVRYGGGAAWLQEQHPGARPEPRPLRGMVRSGLGAAGSLLRGRAQEAGLRAIDALGYAAYIVGTRRSNLPRG